MHTCRWLLRLLSLLGGLSRGIFFIPIAAVLLSPFQCKAVAAWTDVGYTCFAGGHLALTVVGALLLVVHVAFAAAFAAFVADAHPLSPSASGRAHGRVDVYMLLLKLTL